VEKWHERGYIPHFDGGPIPQMVTFRLIDSFPSGCLQKWRLEFSMMERIQAEAERRRRIEEYLDKGQGEAWLSQPRIGDLVVQTIRHFDGQRCHLYAWCVMPNHVHVLLRPNSGQNLSEILHTWKSFSSKKANALLGRSGPFWQREYFDRFIRHEGHFLAAIDYIESNPVKAGLIGGPAEWPFSSAFVRKMRHSLNLPGSR
jgi:REP element-mobilizing transposase RayT